MDNINISHLVGKTLIHIQTSENKSLLTLFTQDKVFEFYHEQDCCEDVSINDIVGDFEDLLNTPLLVAQESSSTHEANLSSHESDEANLWTFYKFATVKGWVDIRWLGSSNGYYSMAVSLVCRDYGPSDTQALIKKEHGILMQEVGLNANTISILDNAKKLKI